MVEHQRMQPAFEDGHSAIVFAANDWFCPYMSVMLRSVLDHISLEHTYDIIILHRDITSQTQGRIMEMAAGHSAVSIRFYCVTQMVEGFNFYTGGKEDFSVDTYLRLLIPWVLSDSYDKALYLDGDMLALTDIAPLLDEDLTGYLLASSRDINGIAEYYTPLVDRKAYRNSILPGENLDNYFISGMLVLNLNLLRKETKLEDLLHLAASRKWLQHDQDVLNILCKGGRAKLIHASWDVLKPYKPEYLPPALRKELEESLADPKILHFGGDDKPWKNLLSPWMDAFWETAVRTPFYKDIIYRILQERPSTGNEIILKRFEDGKIGFKYVMIYFRAWLHYKIKLLKKN